MSETYEALQPRNHPFIALIDQQVNISLFNGVTEEKIMNVLFVGFLPEGFLYTKTIDGRTIIIAYSQINSFEECAIQIPKSNLLVLN